MFKFFKLFIASLFFISLQAKEPTNVLTFKIPTIDGKVITIKEAKNGLVFDDFKGKVILLEFWGTHCPPCLRSIEHYKEIIQKYKDKVAMIAIEVQQTPKDYLKKFVQRKGINYYIIAQEDAHNFIRYVSERAGWRGAIPFLIAFDTNGDVIEIRRGYANKEYVEALINYGLNKKGSIK